MMSYDGEYPPTMFSVPVLFAKHAGPRRKAKLSIHYLFGNLDYKTYGYRYSQR